LIEEEAMTSTLCLSKLLDTELTSKLEIEADAALPAGRTRQKRKKLLQLGFGEVADK